MFYPYSSFFSTSLSISSTDYFTAVAFQEITGPISLFLSPFFELMGPEVVIIGSFLLNSLCLVLIASVPSYPLFIICRCVCGFLRSSLETGVQHMLGVTIPKEMMGRATGMVETSLGCSSLIGIPLVGFIIQQISW